MSFSHSRITSYNVCYTKLLRLYQLAELRIPHHAAVAETVEGARDLGRPWATKLVNGVLRSYLRETEALNSAADAVPAARLAHPEWLLKLLRAEWPEQSYNFV